MNCNEFDSLMADYIDGKLTLQQKTAFENHLNECQNCAGVFAFYKNTINALNHMPEVDCPDNVVEKIFDKAGLRQKRKTVIEIIRELFPEHLSWKPAVTAAALIIIIAGLTIFQPFEKKPPQTAYSKEEIMQAQKDVKLALGYFYACTSKTTGIVESELIKDVIAKPVRSTVKNLFKILSNGG